MGGFNAGLTAYGFTTGLGTVDVTIDGCTISGTGLHGVGTAQTTRTTIRNTRVTGKGEQNVVFMANGQTDSPSIGVLGSHDLDWLVDNCIVERIANTNTKAEGSKNATYRHVTVDGTSRDALKIMDDPDRGINQTENCLIEYCLVTGMGYEYSDSGTGGFIVLNSVLGGEVRYNKIQGRVGGVPKYGYADGFRVMKGTGANSVRCNNLNIHHNIVNAPATAIRCEYGDNITFFSNQFNQIQCNGANGGDIAVSVSGQNNVIGNCYIETVANRNFIMLWWNGSKIWVYGTVFNGTDSPNGYAISANSNAGNTGGIGVKPDGTPAPNSYVNLYRGVPSGMYAGTLAGATSGDTVNVPVADRTITSSNNFVPTGFVDSLPGTSSGGGTTTVTRNVTFRLNGDNLEWKYADAADSTYVSLGSVRGPSGADGTIVTGLDASAVAAGNFGILRVGASSVVGIHTTPSDVADGAGYYKAIDGTLYKMGAVVPFTTGGLPVGSLVVATPRATLGARNWTTTTTPNDPAFLPTPTRAQIILGQVVAPDRIDTYPLEAVLTQEDTTPGTFDNLSSYTLDNNASIATKYSVPWAALGDTGTPRPLLVGTDASYPQSRFMRIDAGNTSARRVVVRDDTAAFVDGETTGYFEHDLGALGYIRFYARVSGGVGTESGICM